MEAVVAQRLLPAISLFACKSRLNCTAAARWLARGERRVITLGQPVRDRCRAHTRKAREAAQSSCDPSRRRTSRPLCVRSAADARGSMFCFFSFRYITCSCSLAFFSIFPLLGAKQLIFTVQTLQSSGSRLEESQDPRGFLYHEVATQICTTALKFPQK